MKWDGGPPANFGELFKFYHEYVKALYSSVQIEGSLPQELLFELNAALDHISRHWVYGEAEQKSVNKAYSHLKRCCLDVFKIRVREVSRQYHKLLRIDTSIINHGDYDRDMIALFGEIQTKATEARRLEGKTDTDEMVPSFELWQQVHVLCEQFEREFFRHPRLPWAQRKQNREAIRQRIIRWAEGSFLFIVLKLLIQPTRLTWWALGISALIWIIAWSIGSFRYGLLKRLFARR